MKVLTLVFSAFISSATYAGNLKCRGVVDVKGESNYQAEVFVMFGNSIASGQLFSLGNPVTEDIESVVRWRIVHFEKTSGGTDIIAVIDRSAGNSRLSFSLQSASPEKILLADFKGFEGSTPFGPNDVECRY